MEALALFLWGENLEHVRVFGRSGWLSLKRLGRFIAFGRIV
ncbi:hypothetical protein [Helicobacter pylori]|nr:hypothetical protein [Helicobacter pylori]